MLFHGDETIFLVEDEKAVRLTITMYLTELGYNVLSAEDPSKALRIAEEHDEKIDVVITDVIMPKMNGRELVEKLSSLYSDFKTLYISGYPVDVITDRGILEKGVHFLPKPLIADVLAKTLRTILDS